jgi:hypothetical protein
VDNPMSCEMFELVSALVSYPKAVGFEYLAGYQLS